MPEDNLQLFGGDWTEQKLKALGSYLAAYTTVLKKQPFHKAYIDAFAGTGYREESSEIVELFAELLDEEPTRYREGSATIALKNKPPFDSFAFIEASTKRVAELNLLKEKFPEYRDRIAVHKGDANELLCKWCGEGDWRNTRAVVFLDPFGMQVDWTTIEQIALTRAIDLWILFPIFGVVRMLRDKPDIIPLSWAARLDKVFGCHDWIDSFYKTVETPNMFGSIDQAVTKVATAESIGTFYLQRLGDLFHGQVAENPLVLRNSVNSPLYQLFFAAGNPRGAGPALRIADHILGKLK